MIAELQTELDDEGAEEKELMEQLGRLQKSIEAQSQVLATLQKALGSLLEQRANILKQIAVRKARLEEIEELVARFKLLDSHYETDLHRLEAIHESGNLFYQLEAEPCPLCGALPSEQHLDSECEGNTEIVVQAADAEMIKILRLRRELSETVETLTKERAEIDKSLSSLEEYNKGLEGQIKEITAASISAGRGSYDQFVSERSKVMFALDKIGRLNRLLTQRSNIESGTPEVEDGQATTRTIVSRNVLDEYAKKIESILQEWHFPNASRVFFDEKSHDLQIAGKHRGSSGKGLRAITHAAI
jgi:small-conductance mechanosensitive channel